jgi:C-terminal processing protease CtpA/Prc
MTIQMLKPNIGYIDINSFELNQVEEDSIQRFIQSAEKNKLRNLIIDVRNNVGGDQNVLYRLTSYFTTNPYQTNCYREVKSNTTYPAFCYTDNYSADDVLFSDFNTITSKKTFTQSISLTIAPSATNFSGKLYILVDEFSVSAASEFAAILLQQGIGTIIGRETGTCYYQMNAEKFAYFRLGTTGLSLAVPLVKLVSRDVVHPKIPYGRGVIPDVEVPLSLEEFTQSKDVVLERALDLIEEKEKSLGD